MQTSYNRIVERLTESPAKAHFAGIGGMGMAGLAYILKKMGWEVSGCDAARNQLFTWLEDSGIRTCEGNSPDHLSALNPDKDIFVRTNAMPLFSPELTEAAEEGMSVYLRGTLLAALSGMHDTIAVCGTHGKTTTSSFAASILKKLRPASSGWCVGGINPYLGSVAGGEMPGNANDDTRGLFVAEADESDGTLALYTPEVTVLNNIDFDHIEFFHDEVEMEDVFRSALRRTKRAIVYCADHNRASEIANEEYSAKRISFGFSPNADFRISEFTSVENGTEFTLVHPDGMSRIIHMQIRGRHNMLNAAAAIAAVCAIGIDFDEACVAFEKVAVLPDRRFERIGKPDGFTVISDFSHHPVEIMALMETAMELPHKRIVAVFQPHRFTRTKTLLKHFPEAFQGVDELVLCPVYCASECLICGGAASDLYSEFRTAATGNIHMPIPVFAPSPEAASRYVQSILQPGDLVLIIGAGDINLIAKGIAAAKPVEKVPIEVRIGAFGTSAIAPKMTVVRSVPEVQEAVKKGEFAVISGGTNSFICPTGCHKTLIRLAGPVFGSKSVVEETEDHVIMDLGAAMQGPSLVRYCLDQGYSGLEFMAGIPGYCGGWVAMNAGTRTGSFCDRIESVDVVTADGSTKTLMANELGAAYRSCPGVEGTVVTKVRIKLYKSSPIAVRIAMDDALASRLDFSGIRSAGSIFKNPPSPLMPAGMILEKAGCKGLRIGGAYVTEDHANVIASEQDATASDVYALITMMRELALTSTGVLLEPEVRILG